jgi:enoyl-CoA hydratase/carnithine racemase
MSGAASDLLGADALSPLKGSPLVLLEPGERLPPGGVRLLVDAQGRLPEVAADAYDVMVTTRAGAPAPWVSVPAERLASRLAEVQRIAALSPLACHTLARVLRLTERLALEEALELESLAYSTLLGGEEFARWLRATPHDRVGNEPDARLVRYDREGDDVTLTLASPATRNAMSAAMRDALFEALVNVLEDPSAPAMLLRAEGRCFSVGGDLAEFGTARDLAAAHVIRTQRSCAAVLNRIGTRAQAHLHGACIGSGIEVPAAAARVTAARDLIVQLPELRMGLIPGAGGTVTLARRIGRHRLAWLCLGAFRIGADQALEWGLIEAVTP